MFIDARITSTSASPVLLLLGLPQLLRKGNMLLNYRNCDHSLNRWIMRPEMRTGL